MANDSTAIPSVDGHRSDQTSALGSFFDRAADRLQNGDLDGAMEAYEQAILRAPHDPEPYLRLGRLFQQISQPEAALACFQDGVAADPDFVPLRQSLGFLLSHLGEPAAALEHYEHALRVSPSPLTRLLAATVLPAIYDSHDDVSAWRQRVTAELDRLEREGVRVKTLRSQLPTPFYLAYQGENDRDIAAAWGRLVEGHLCCPAAGDQPRIPRQGRLRIGFLSAFFQDHTIGRLNLGLIERLDRSRFEVLVLAIDPHEDALASRFRAGADCYLPLPRDVEAARRTIASSHLDVLVFADVGMDSVASTLAHSRMAPIQCATWGHPVTTGSATMDYFVSSELLETDAGDGHYTEQLVRLPLLGVFYVRPPVPAALPSRESLGLAPDARTYACPQTLYKFHPDFDAILAEILRRDPRAEIVLLEGRVANWGHHLRRRFQQTLPDCGRVRFLPSLPSDQFLALLAHADVVLDPLHFGGGNSSYEAFAVGAPVVTLPSRFLRGRITAALYHKMGIAETVVGSPESYAETAVRIACDAEYGRDLRARIRGRSQVLFEDPEEVRVWERFLWSLTESRRLFVQPRCS